MDLPRFKAATVQAAPAFDRPESPAAESPTETEPVLLPPAATRNIKIVG
jgi:hypothetical protein